MLSSIAERQLQSQGQGGPATMPNLFNFEQEKPKISKVLSKEEVKQAIANIPDKKAAIRKLIDEGFELEGLGDVAQEPTRSFGEQSKDFLGALSVAPYKAVGGVGSVLGDVVSAPFSDTVSYGGIFTGGNKGGIGQFFRNTVDSMEKGITESYGANTGSTGYKAGEIAGGIATTLPVSVATGGLGLAGKFSQASTAGKLGLGALGGIGETALGYTATEGRLGTPTELGVGAGLGVAGTGLGMGLSKFFSKPALTGTADNLTGMSDDVTKRASELQEAIAGPTQKGKIGNIVVDIPVPGNIGRAVEAVKGVVQSNDKKVLAGKALTPSYAGKTPKQIVNTIETAEKNAKELHRLVRSGEIAGDLTDLSTSARTVIDAIDDVGGKIGGLIKNAKGKVSISDDTLANLQSALSKVSAKRTPVSKTIENLIEDIGDGLDIQEAFALKKVYANEVGKFIKSGDAGTEQFSAFTKAVEELTDQIDNAVFASKGGKELTKLKQQYKTLKSISSDLAKSAQVEARKSPMGLVEQLGYLDALTDPTGFIKQQFAKQVSDMNSRGGTWKRLMDLYDQDAIKAFKNPKNIQTPKAPTVKPTSKAKNLSNLTRGKGGFVDIGAIADDIAPKKVPKELNNIDYNKGNIKEIISKLEENGAKQIGVGDGSYYYALDDGSTLRVSDHSNVTVRGVTDRSINKGSLALGDTGLYKNMGEFKLPNFNIPKISFSVPQIKDNLVNGATDGQILAIMRKEGNMAYGLELLDRGRIDLLKKVGIDENGIKKYLNDGINSLKTRLLQFTGKNNKPLPSKKELYNSTLNDINKLEESLKKITK